jgi:hypothetical protein
VAAAAAAAAVPFFLAGRSAAADGSAPNESAASWAKEQRLQRESSIWVIDNVLVLTSRR